MSAYCCAYKFVAPWLYSSLMPIRSASVLMESAASRSALAIVISISPGRPPTSALLTATTRAEKSIPCSLSRTCTSLPGICVSHVSPVIRARSIADAV